MNQWMERLTGGGTNGWTKIPSYADVIDASEKVDFPTDLAISTKALQPMDRWIGRLMYVGVLDGTSGTSAEVLILF